jgi:tetratricopeptide (TPR) repeat protein
MSRYFQWLILTSLTGSPILSIAILVVFWFVLDRFTFGLLPDPLRFLMRWQRTWRLERLLGANPHDRRARQEVAELYLWQRRYKKAVEALKPNLEAGDDDANTLFTMGWACFGAGHAEQAEVFMAEAAERDPAFRVGAIDLELGRWRLAGGNAKGALEALERFIHVRRGSVEGRVLLAKAMLAAGDDGKAALMREEAWKEYVSAPRFQRRMERFWAWRAKPSRPATYAALLLLVGALFSLWGAPPLVRAAQHTRGVYGSAMGYDRDADGRP